MRATSIFARSRAEIHVLYKEKIFPRQKEDFQPSLGESSVSIKGSLLADF